MGHFKPSFLNGDEMVAIRWISLIPACILTWFGVVSFGLHLLTVIEGYCDPEDIVSGCCMAEWYTNAVTTVIVSCVGLSAFMVVVCATVIAPASRLIVAWIAYLFGIGIAFYFWSQTDATTEFRAAAVGGFIAVFAITMLLGKRILRLISNESEQVFEYSELKAPPIGSEENH